ncbi:MAG TPA: hypothetical protein VGR70_09025 [Stellaceae bacterium]|nr:hypothetical protein [Stellaceae bacterium]
MSPISGKATTGLSHLSRPEERWPRFAAELVAQTTIDELVETLALVCLDFIKRISSAPPLARSLAVLSA